MRDMLVQMRANHVTKRGEVFLYERRVPLRFLEVAGVKRVRRSLDTKDPAVAKMKAAELDKAYEAHWHALLAGKAPEQEARFEAAKRIAETAGFPYKPSTEITDPIEIIRRVEAPPDDPSKASETQVRALLGTAEPPSLKLSDALEFYLERTAYERKGSRPERWCMSPPRAEPLRSAAGGGRGLF